MKSDLLYPGEEIEKIYAYLDQAIVIKVGYLLLLFVLQGLKVYHAPDVVYIAVSLMALISLVIGIWFEKFSVKIKTVINALFIGTLLDLVLLSILIYYLSGIEFIYYSFFIILSFIVFPRTQAIAITSWTIFLFLALVLLRYFQIIPDSPPVIPKEEQTFYSLNNVVTNVPTIVLTLSFLGYFSYGFYKIMARRLIILKRTQRTLEDEKASLEIRIQARKRELEIERKNLEKRVQERKRELENESKELEERAREMERFQKVSGGREEKKTNLEKELEQLEEKTKGYGKKQQ